MSTEEERVIITKPIIGIAHMQVCAASDATDEEILSACNRGNPSGTEHGWSIVCRTDDEFCGKLAPVQCASDATRTHYMVAC